MFPPVSLHLEVLPWPGSPPVPQLSPEQQFWSLHPPAVSQHQTRYPGMPESEPAACRSLCALAAEVKQVKAQVRRQVLVKHIIF